MADAAGEGADALSAETTQLLGGQLAFVRHADPQAGQCDVPYLAQVAGAAEGAEPGLGFGGVDGRLDIFSTEILSKYHPKYLSVLPLFMRSDRRGTKKIFSKQTDLSLSASKY